MLVLFSKHEKLVLHILGRRKMTVHQIAEEFYHSQELPMEGQNYIAGVVRKIQKKYDQSNSVWAIYGEGGGRGGKTVWRAKRS